MSRIDFACTSENEKAFIKSIFATLASFAARIIFMTSSMLSSAILNPSKI